MEVGLHRLQGVIYILELDILFLQLLPWTDGIIRQWFTDEEIWFLVSFVIAAAKSMVDGVFL